MINRRKFLETSSLLTGGLVAGSLGYGCNISIQDHYVPEKAVIQTTGIESNAEGG